MVRALDIFFALSGLIILSPVLLTVTLVNWINIGSPFFLQERVGQNKKIFQIIKFRTLKVGTASVATHLADLSNINSFSKFLRSSSLDELPQLFNVLIGDMSFVGPRPCLKNQKTLIREREKLNLFLFRPGITGLAQIAGIDMSTPAKLASVDYVMMKDLTVDQYLKLILKTVASKLL